ncbi:MarR family winged helix-turn-helix transcriptional regulator [Curtobacterium ammoniigenes]|uniref:MarR family winged helix-turn-helix transcriptional regulator n=1 Tax=Curtobacterium ammoniigenes TaxID=395387 RepID=UPI00082FB5E4|nr:MarR family transcriptional regulator [Curtobacterium ammoniigenes]
MAQDDNEGVDLPTSIGYLLKEAATALRTAMEEVLRPLDMTVTHYSCLELLAQRPGMSNSELARGAFVTRQTMNVLLQALERGGFVSRADTPSTGRILPTELTGLGREQLRRASARVRSVEQTMLCALSATDQDAARRLLREMVQSLQRDGEHCAQDLDSA